MGSYNDILRVTVPTIDEIKEYTSFDLTLEEGNKERAEAKVLSLVSKAKDYLYLGKSFETQNVFSYLIKFNTEWKRAWELYAIKYIEATFNFGDESAWANTPKPIYNAVNGSILRTQFFTDSTLSEVRNSDKEW